MKKCSLFSVITILLLGFLLSSQALASEKKRLLFLNDSNKEPFTTKDKDGFLDIILAEAFQRIGYKFNTVHLPAERGLLSANQGIVDGEVNRIAGLGKIYKNLIQVPEKIRDSEFCALSKNAEIVNTPDELNKYVVGHIKGWKIFDKLMTGSKKVVTTTTPEQLFRLLKKDRIEVALYDCVEGLVLIRRFYMEDIHILKPDFIQRELFIYLNKRHINLIPKLSKALQDIKKEGLYDRLYHEKILPIFKY